MNFVLRYIFIIILISSVIEASIYNNSLNNLTLKSASELDYPPFSIVTKDGKADGFSVELLRESVAVMGGSIVYKVDKWETIKQELKDGKIDVLPLVGRTDERAKYYDFTVPYLVMHGAVFIRKGDARIQSYADLKDKVIVVMKGDNAEEYVRKNKVGKEIITFDNYTLAFEALSSGKYDAVVAQKLVGTKLISTLGLKNIKSANFFLENFKQDFSFAVKHSKKDEKLLALLNEGLSIVMVNGTYEKLYEKWFHYEDINTTLLDSKYFQLLIIAFILVFILFLFYLTWNNSLKIKVKERTRELSVKIQTIEKLQEQVIAQSRHAAMGEMISMIAHQWRQPITAIAMGANNILADIELDILEKETLKSDSKNIIIQTQELSKIIDDFKNFFRPGKVAEELLVEDVLSEVFSIIGKSLENNNIEVFKDFKNEKKIKTYSRELMQVFINILKNAKEVLIENIKDERKIFISIKENKNKVIIKICDNAGGIEEGTLNKIFDPYFTTKSEINGTGLGLYISKTIIEKHLNGTLNAYNEDGGACFEIYLPYLLKES